MAARKAKDNRRRAARQTSNVFAMFDQKQIAEFKEAFSMIDQNKDGFIDKQDLKDILADLNFNATEEYIDEMLSETAGNINFTLFLTLMGERLSGTDTEQEILQAFECFDENNTGFIDAAQLRELMTTMGNRFTQEQVDIMYKGAPPKDGQFDYRKFVRMLKHGEQDGTEQQQQQQQAA